jgi:ethanolamine ammonia-lyase large subunit
VPDLVPVLLDGLARYGHSVGVPLLVPYGRVKLAEALGDALRPRLVVMLIGERPGGDAMAARSLSAYLALRLTDPDVIADARRFSGNDDIRYEYTVISNIYSGGLPAIEAGSVIAERVAEILRHEAAGNRLEAKRAAFGAAAARSSAQTA